MPELPENVENAILDAELTPDEKLVAEEQAQEKLEPVVDIKPETPEGPRDLPEEPQVDPQNNGKLPEHLVNRAKEFNFSDQELAAFDSPEHLEYWLNKFDNEMLNRFQGYEQQFDQMPQQQMPQEQMPQEAPPADMPELKFDEYMDEGIKANFEALQAQVKQQQELIDYMAYQGYQSEQQSTISQFEDQIANLGEDFHPLLGKSVDERSTANSQYGQNAERLWDVYGQLSQLSPNTPSDDLFRRAVGVAFPEYQTELAMKKQQASTVDRVRDASGRFVARPSRRSAQTVAPGGEDQEWYEGFDQMAQEKGWNVAPRMSIDELFGE
tara:strand:- start:36 stop:1010 length:975 start_codon:yes stop_codon:yes gene_type:complete